MQAGAQALFRTLGYTRPIHFTQVNTFLLTVDLKLWNWNTSQFTRLFKSYKQTPRPVIQLHTSLQYLKHSRYYLYSPV